MMDSACAAPEEGAESGEAAAEEARDGDGVGEALNVKPKRQRVRNGKGKGRETDQTGQ